MSGVISTGSLKSLLKFLYTQRVRGFDPPLAPHLDDMALPVFEMLLRECTFYLEFGSGGSTVLADALRVRGLSVEVDRYYAAAVRSALSRDSTINVMSVHVGWTRQWGKPIVRRKSRRRLARWSRYSTVPFDVLRGSGDFPDFVLVDGRFRRACALNTARHAILEGRSLRLLFDDYYKPDRRHYSGIESFLGIPTKHGRAALFQISEATVVRAPKLDDILEASGDFR